MQNKTLNKILNHLHWKMSFRILLLFCTQFFQSQIHVSNGAVVHVEKGTLVSATPLQEKQQDAIIYVNSATIISNSDVNSQFKVVALKKENSKQASKLAEKKITIPKSEVPKKQIAHKKAEEVEKPTITISHSPDSNQFIASAKHQPAVVVSSSNSQNIIATNTGLHRVADFFETTTQHNTTQYTVIHQSLGITLQYTNLAHLRRGLFISYKNLF